MTYSASSSTVTTKRSAAPASSTPGYSWPTARLPPPIPSGTAPVASASVNRPEPSVAAPAWMTYSPGSSTCTSFASRPSPPSSLWRSTPGPLSSSSESKSLLRMSMVTRLRSRRRKPYSSGAPWKAPCSEEPALIRPPWLRPSGTARRSTSIRYRPWPPPPQPPAVTVYVPGDSSSARRELVPSPPSSSRALTPSPETSSTVSNWSEDRSIVYMPSRSTCRASSRLPSSQSVIRAPARSGWPSQPSITCVLRV